MKSLVVIPLIFHVAFSYIFLEKLSHTKLPSRVTPSEVYQMFGGAAEEAAYDKQRRILYVVGEESRLLHLMDLADPKNPVLATSYQFTPSDGTPRDVAVCGDEVAVAVTSGIRDVYEGHVYFFHAFSAGDPELKFDGKLPTGYFPDMLTFTSDCKKILVANEGRPGKDINNVFVDPEGSVTIIERERTGNPSERTVSFSGQNQRFDLRFPTRYIPQNVWPGTANPTFEQDATPEYIAISPDNKYAYIILQRNNAVATMSLSTYDIQSITPIPKKDWSKYTIDPSDRDGGVHLRQYPFKSVRQPDNAKVITIGRKSFLITADEGRTTDFTSAHDGFVWSDHSLADVLTRQNKFDTTVINNDTFIEALKLDNKAGRLTLSTIDGLNLFTGKMDEVNHFGGRGFSIWKTSDLSLVFDSGDEIEKELANSIKVVFNTDCIKNTITYQGPENLRDTQSDNYGPKVGSLDYIKDYDQEYIVVGSETTGTIFVYSVNSTSGTPEPQFETAYRTGDTDFVWSELYEMGTAGDAGLSAVGFISRDDNPLNKTLIYAIGQYSGSVTLFQIENL
ncbi:mesenchyme-specific cell surface glycoprotein-like [Saccostrea echinata]|uniref:mesenchyme-specific cell surface glycoprotein-like n=1 Tax=Saccostrea echinata TaxID=191078 RepID=UPI002A80F4A3|nr:mesenchyme-specific cell surface glycoprotein-like [Saccostrea echinata]